MVGMPCSQTSRHADKRRHAAPSLAGGEIGEHIAALIRVAMRAAAGSCLAHLEAYECGRLRAARAARGDVRHAGLDARPVIRPARATNNQMSCG